MSLNVEVLVVFEFDEKTTRVVLCHFGIGLRETPKRRSFLLGVS